jgi:hypothetical protein
VKSLPWTLLGCAIGLIIWLSLALVNAENQRHALMSGLCADRAFKGEIDDQCLASVQSRAHWWQHLQHGLTHLQR